MIGFILAQALLLSGPTTPECIGTINPKLGPYGITMYLPTFNQRWEWTYLDYPFQNRTAVNGCVANCNPVYTIKRLAPYSSANYVPDAYKVEFRVYNAYHVFVEQHVYTISPTSGLMRWSYEKRDLCVQREEP